MIFAFLKGSCFFEAEEPKQAELQTSAFFIKAMSGIASVLAISSVLGKVLLTALIASQQAQGSENRPCCQLGPSRLKFCLRLARSRELKGETGKLLQRRQGILQQPLRIVVLSYDGVEFIHTMRIRIYFMNFHSPLPNNDDIGFVACQVVDAPVFF